LNEAMTTSAILLMLMAASLATAATIRQVLVPPILPEHDPPTLERVMTIAADDQRLYFTVSTWSETAIGSYDLRTGATRLIIGGNNKRHCDGNKTRAAGIPDDPYPLATAVALSAPVALTALGSGQMLISQSMPASHVLWAGPPPPFGPTSTYNVSRQLGTRCDYKQQSEANAYTAPQAANTTELRTTHIPAPQYTAYRQSTGDMFVAFSQSIGIVRPGRSFEHFFGITAVRPAPAPAPNNMTNGTNVTNQTFAPVVTLPSMQNSVQRLAASAGTIGQISILDDKYLVVPDGDNSALRLVDLATGLVTAAVAPAGAPEQSWPPQGPCLTDVQGCDGANFTLYLPSYTATYGRDGIFVASSMFPTVFFVNTTTRRIRYVAGALPDLYVRQVTENMFAAVEGLAVSGNTLYISAARGLFAMDINVTDYGPPAANTTSNLCGVWATCGEHASNAIGLPTTGCQCVCKRGWSGTSCGVPPLTVTHTLTTSGTDTVSVQPPEVVSVPYVPPAVEAATTTVAVTVVVAGVVGTPTVATQGSRAQVLLSLKVCDAELDEPLGFTESPTAFRIGNTDLRYHAGAVMSNVGFIALLLFVQFFVVKMVQRYAHCSALEAQAKCRFPSLASFPCLFVLEGTTYAAVTLLYRGNADVSLRMLGAFGIVVVLTIVTIIGLFLKFNFRATFVLFTAANAQNNVNNNNSITSSRSHESIASMDFTKEGLSPFQRARNFIRWLLNVTGKWQEEHTHQTKRFGGMFMDYRPGMQGFAIIEMGMCVLSGVVTGLKALHCQISIIFTMLLFVIFFALVARNYPQQSRFANFMTILIAGLQAIATVLIVIADFSNSAKTAEVAETFVVASMFIVGLLSIVDAISRMYFIMKYVITTCYKRDRRGIANATFLGDEPMLPIRHGSSSEDSVIAGGIRPVNHDGSQNDSRRGSPPPQIVYNSAIPQPGGVFPNFSFTAHTGYMAPVVQQPTPRHSPEPDASLGVPGAQSRTLEELRAELDDLLAGRSSRTTRLDELLEAARTENRISSSSSSSRISSGRPPLAGGVSAARGGEPTMAGAGRGNSSSSGSGNSHHSSTGSLTQHVYHGRSPSNVLNASFGQANNNRLEPAAAARVLDAVMSRNVSNQSLTSLVDAMRQASSTSGENSSGNTTNSSLVRRRGGMTREESSRFENL
jgi:hypothetical protein